MLRDKGKEIITPSRRKTFFSISYCLCQNCANSVIDVFVTQVTGGKRTIEHYDEMLQKKVLFCTV